ncbi:MAG: quinol:cytochrome C oxidoreductase [Planctomycetes bacterium]|jgi:ubiquinol-cytochrome c reductase cytochrome b subunit|nr:quinol:cytochrome C oxidoreductase [Planctomycetota bacterium]
MGWLESRLGLGEILRKTATGKITPRSTGWLHTLGYAALSVLLLQGISGVALAFFYVPAADHAYDSIRFLERDVAQGKLLRALHHWGASVMVVLVALHALRVFFQGGYKAPRELTWLAGLGLLGVTLGFAFTGYLLPWDQKAYFATKVGVNIAGQTPAIGEHLQGVLYGGAGIGPQTLNRFFALHVLVLPAALIGLLVLHLYLIQRHGIAPTRTRTDDAGEPGKPYHPYHTLKEALVAILAVGLVFFLAWRVGAGLEAEADPADLDYDPRPDWYFYAPFQLLKLFKGENEVIGAFWIPAGLGALLALLPFLDRNKERVARKRPIAVACGILFALATIGLTVVGMTDRPTHFATPPHPLGATKQLREGYDLVRRGRCFSCHQVVIDGVTYGQLGEHDEAPPLQETEYEPEDLADFLEDTGMDNMPSFPLFSAAQRLAIGRYLQALRR